MSYIQIEIGGKSRGLKFNVYAIEKMNEKLVGNSAITFAYAMFWGGLLGNSYAKEEEPDYSFSDVIDWIDSLPKETRIQTIEDVTKVMTSTQWYKDIIEAGQKALAPVDETPEEKKSESEELTMTT